MADDGKITLEAELDTSKIEKSIKEMQNKIETMKKSSSQGAFGNLTGGQNQNDLKIKRMEDIRKRENTKVREQILKDLKKQQTMLDSHMKAYEGMSKEQERLKGLKEDTLEIEQKQTAEFEKMADLVKSIEEAQKSLGGGGSGMSGMGGLAKGIQAASTAVAAVGTALLSFNDLEDFMNRRRGQYSAGRTIDLAQASIRPAERAVRGEGFDDLLYADEKDRALTQSMGMGADQFGINRRGAATKGAMGTAGMILGLGALLAAPFTGGGSLLAAGGLAGVIGGGAALTSNKGEGFEAMFGNMGEIDKDTGKQILDDYKIQTEKEKWRDPTLSLLKQTVSENKGTFLQGMRSSGMSEQDYIKSYVQGRGTTGEEDFLFNQRVGMTNQMIGAGGGTGAAYGQNMVTALQAQRGFGLSNAGQVMGKLSNYMGAEESEEAFIRLLGKGFEKGLDQSEFREENKMYMEQVASIAQQMGGNESLVSSLITAGMSDDINRRNIQFAGEGAQNLLNDLGKTEGMIGAQKYRQINKNPMFQGMSKFDRYMMGRMDSADLKSGSQEMEYFYNQYLESGGDPTKTIEDFTKALTGDYSEAQVSGFKQFSQEFKDIGEQFKTGKFKDKEGKEITNPEEVEKRKKQLDQRRGILLKFMKDRKGPFEGVMSEARATLDFQNQGDGSKFQKDLAEYDSMADAEFLLNPEAKKRFEELKKGAGKLRTTPDSGIEKFYAGAGQVQQQEFNAATKDKDGKTIDLNTILKDMSDGVDSALAKSVNERQLLKGFQTALENGAVDVIDAIIQKVSGKRTGLTKKQQAEQQRAARSQIQA